MKIKLKNTVFQTVLEYIAIALMVGMYVYLYIRWSSVPDKIPAHYNALGEINRWGSKGELIILPIVGTFFYILLTVVQLFPSIWNIPVKVTDQNKDKVYQNTKNMLMLMKVEIIAIFFYLNYNGIEVRPLPQYFLPVVLLTIFGTAIFFVVRIFRASAKK